VSGRQPLTTRGPRPAATRSAALAVALPVGLVLGGCARTVAVDPPQPGADQASACTTFTEALPGQLSTVGERRDVDPDSPYTAAYGDPAVSVRCGVPEPQALTATSVLVTVDGIDWFPEELTAGWVMTTVGLVADVEIMVPTEVGPAPSVAADLGPTISTTLRPT
jgi:hypothetical protein